MDTSFFGEKVILKDQYQQNTKPSIPLQIHLSRSSMASRSVISHPLDHTVIWLDELLEVPGISLSSYSSIWQLVVQWYACLRNFSSSHSLLLKLNRENYTAKLPLAQGLWVWNLRMWLYCFLILVQSGYSDFSLSVLCPCTTTLNLTWPVQILNAHNEIPSE